MSESEQPADAGTTDDAPTDEQQHGDDASGEQRATLDWQETQARISKRQQARRELAVDFGDGIAVFTIRGLDDEEQQEVEQAAVPNNQKRRQRRNGGGGVDLSSIDTAAVKDTILKFGIVSGPDGFKPHREDHRKQLPPGVKDQLVDEIEDLGSLDVAEREQFQEVGSR